MDTLSPTNRRLIILGKVIQEMLQTNEWSSTLKDKLDQLEAMIASDVTGPDFDVWTEKLAIYWKQYAKLNPGEVVKSGTIQLFRGDNWRIVISPARIAVFENGHEVKCLDLTDEVVPKKVVTNDTEAKGSDSGNCSKYQFSAENGIPQGNLF